MRKTLWLALVVPVALVACERRTKTNVSTTDTSMTTTKTETTTMAMPSPSTAPSGGEMKVNYEPLNNSGVRGEATLMAKGDSTQITVRLTGAPAGGTHEGHIHRGTCQNIGEVVAALDPITIGSDGTGTMTKTVPIPVATVADGQHVIAYHEAGGKPGKWVTCAAIPKHSM